MSFGTFTFHLYVYTSITEEHKLEEIFLQSDKVCENNTELRLSAVLVGQTSE